MLPGKGSESSTNHEFNEKLASLELGFNPEEKQEPDKWQKQKAKEFIENNAPIQEDIKKARSFIEELALNKKLNEREGLQVIKYCGTIATEAAVDRNKAKTEIT